MSLEVTILGCGSSGGVPRVGSGWGACDPKDPRNRRRRCSILIRRGAGEATTRVLVDTSPDLREQLLAADVRALDGVVMTHEHADHTHGLDDLRPLAIHMRRRVPLYADARTGEMLESRFGYCFHTPPDSDYPPIIDEHRIVVAQAFAVNGAGGPIEILPFRLEHGNIDALGLRFENIAYTPDVSAIPEESLPFLRGLDLWIIDALRYTRHPTHFSLAEALTWIERMRPQRAVLTNLHTDLDYETVAAELPANVQPAHDGLRLTAGAVTATVGAAF